MNLEKSFCVKPLSIDVIPGTSVTINLPTMLNVEVGAVYTIGPVDIPAPYVGKEEVIVNIDKAYAGLDNCGKYVTAQMLHNPCKRCPLIGDRFRIQIVAIGTEKAVVFRRGLSCRRTYLDVVTPSTP